MLGDPGGTLRQSQVPVDLLLTSVYFVNARLGWAEGHDGVILNTSDGGATWAMQIEDGATGALMKLSAERRIAQLQAESPGDEVSSALENANFMLDDINAGLQAGPSRPLLDIWFRNADEGWAVGAYGTVLHTGDGGKRWQFVEGLDDPDRLHLKTVVGLGDGTLLIAGEGGRIYRCVDGGSHWTSQPPLTPASLYKLIALRDGQVLVLGLGGTLLSSHDQGEHWQLISIPTRSNLYGGTQLPDRGVALVGQGGTVFARSGCTPLRALAGTRKSHAYEHSDATGGADRPDRQCRPEPCSAIGNRGQPAMNSQMKIEATTREAFLQRLVTRIEHRLFNHRPAVLILSIVVALPLLYFASLLRP